MNRIVETSDGYDCIVDGTRYGTWRSRAEASAGMATEIIRHDARDAAERRKADLEASARTRSIATFPSPRNI